MRLLGLVAAAVLLAQARAAVPVYYTDTGGNGVPVVLMHAATGSTQSWEHQTPAFVKAGYRVIAFDRRGWGRSTADAGSSTAADDLIALMDSLHIDRFHLIGTAAGGFVTLDAALSFPSRLRTIVVANSIGGVTDPDFVALDQRIRPPAFRALPPELREVSPSYRVSNPEGTKRWLELETISRPQGAPPAQPLKNTITFARLEAVTTPALLLTGDADMIAPPPILKMFAMHMKHAETVIVPEAGHSTYWEQPDAFNRAVLTFIRKH